MSPRPPAWFRVGTLTPFIALAVALAALTLAGLASSGALSRARAADPPSAGELASALARVGLAPEALAAAGCSAADATAVGSDTKAYLTPARWSDLAEADNAERAARADTDRLGRLVRAGQATNQDLAAYSAARSALASAAAAREALLEDLFEAAAARLDANETALLATMRANAGRPVPIPFRVASRTDPEWTALRDALANLKTSALCGEEADNTCAQLVNQRSAEPDVAAAQSALEANLDSVSAALSAALNNT